MFGAPFGRSVWAIFALAALAEPTLGQTESASDPSEYLNLSSVELLPQLLPSSARRPQAEVCDALEAALPPTAIADLAVRATCAYHGDLFFVLARFQNGGFSNIRFKLNSSLDDQSQDLLALSAVLDAFHDQLGWPAPTDFLAAVTHGRAFSCRAGVLQYEFSRERGDVPRFNAVMRLAGEPAQIPDSFRNTIQPCSR